MSAKATAPTFAELKRSASVIGKWRRFEAEGRELARLVELGAASREQRRRLAALVAAMEQTSTGNVKAFAAQLAKDVHATMLALCQSAKDAFKRGVRPRHLAAQFVAVLPHLDFAVPNELHEELADALQAMFQRRGSNAPTPIATAERMTCLIVGDQPLAGVRRGITREQVRRSHGRKDLQPTAIDVGGEHQARIEHARSLYARLIEQS